MNIKYGVVVAIIAALLAGVFYYGLPVHKENRVATKMSGEDLKTFVPGDQWKWHLEIPLHLTGSVSGDIYLHIDAWGNYTEVMDYNVSNTVQKVYYVSIEGWGLGDGTLDTDYGTFDIRINGDSTSGSDGYDSNIPFRVMGHRVVRVSDLADVEMRIRIPDAWMHADLGWLLGYDELELKLDATITFWNDTTPYVPDNMDFPVNVGEKMWYNISLRTFGYFWNSDDSQGYVNEKNNTFDDNATWNYTFEYPTYHDVTVGAGTFSCYNATGTNAAGNSHIYLEYAPDLKWYAKETYQNIKMGSNGYMTLKFEVEDYSIGQSSNTLSLSSNEIYQGDSLAISGNIPDAPNREITIAIPEHGIYYTTSSDGSGHFTYSIDRFPLLNDTTHTSIDYGSVGIVAYPSDDPSDLCVETLTIQKLPSHILYGYVRVPVNLNNITINITNVATGDSLIVAPNNTTGYYEIDISLMFYGYRNGDEIKGMILENGTPTSYSNTTIVDTSTTSQEMDFNQVVPEMGYPLVMLLALPAIIILLKREGMLRR